MSQAWNLGESPRPELRSAHGPRQRVVLVTGGTDGIGRAVALDLARAGDRVLFVGRDPERGAAVLSELSRVGPSAPHAFLPADLSLLSETARVCRQVADLTSQLDALVLCAGILSTVPEWTAENLERNFVLNYLTRFLTARQLLPLLCDAPAGRIVLVANAGKYPDTLDFDDLQHRRGKAGLAVSGRTQFANDLLAVELAEQLRATRIEVSCVFPGVTRSSCFANARGLPWLLRWLAPLAVRLLGQSTAKAAQTPVALARETNGGGSSGRFFGPGLKPIDVPERALNAKRRTALWQASEALVRSAAGTDPKPVRLAGAPACIP
jgi:NAD(P)-dependent dehydrogenase (short-subunit alcohol dehydrogenase family)